MITVILLGWFDHFRDWNFMHNNLNLTVYIELCKEKKVNSCGLHRRFALLMNERMRGECLNQLEMTGRL